MLKRIFRITLLFFLAWFLEPVLSTILPLPTESMMDGILNLEKDSHQSLFKLCRYIVWVIFLAVMFRFTGPFLSFALPFSKRFSVTKPMRRFQGVFAEVFLFGLIFMILGLMIAPITADNHFDDLVERHRKKWMEKTDVTDKIDSLDIELFQNSTNTRNFIWNNRFKYFVGKNTWPLAPNSNYNNYYKVVYGYSFNSLTFTNSWAAKDIARLEKYLSSRKYAFSSNYPETPYLSDEVRQNIIKVYNAVSPITKNATYLAHLERNETLEKEKEYLETAKLYMDENPAWHVKRITEYAETDAWTEIGSLANWWFIGFKSGGWFILILALIGYSTTHFTDRTILGKQFTKFMMFIEQSRFGLGGSARFAGLFEEWALLFKKQKEGLFMGRSLYNSNLSIGLEDPRHMMTIAGTRAGKGTTSIIPNLLLWKGSALVIDPKGTNAAVTAQRRRDLGQDVHLIDPFNVLGEKEETACFNPLEWLDPDSPHIREQVNIIAEALVVPDQYQKEKHWDDGAKTVIAGMIAHLVSSNAPQYENPTLSMLREMISCMPEDQAVLWADMSLNDGAGRMAKDAANRVIRGIGTNEISGLISNADKHTEWLSSPSMVKTLGSSSFQFSDLKDKPTTLYLILPPEYLETHNRFLRLFVNLMISNMSIGGRAKVPVLLLMDEFLALGRMEEVEKAFGLMAGYNLIMWPFIQDLGRLQDMYGKSVNAFIANSRAVQVYGISDTETTEYVSNAVGDRSLNASYKSKPDRYNNVVKLRTPSEVAVDIAADTNRQYILRAGKAPLIIEKVPYYKDELFRGKYDSDPDYKKG